MTALPSVVHTRPVVRPRTRTVVAATLGNFVEWYDFVVYGYFAAFLAQAFFPADDPLTGLLVAFAGFGVAFCMRPVGALFFGSVGDRFGRRATLSWILLIASAATFAIGCIPGYARVGVVAPLLVVVARMAQGFAAGGEYGGATAYLVECAPECRRAFYGSLQAATMGLAMLAGAMFGAALTAWMAPGPLLEWGWRIPFLVAFPLGFVGLYLRCRLDETPSFAAVDADRRAAAPLRAVLSGHRRPLARAVGLVAGWSTTAYLLVYLPAYIPLAYSYEPLDALLGVGVGLAVYAGGSPLVALVADTVGRRPVLLVAAGGSAVFAVPAFLLLSLGGPLPLLLATVGIGGILACYGAAGSTLISELFPTRVRYTALSVGYSVAVSVFGGFSPLIATWLLASTGVSFAPGLYVAATGVVAFVAMSTVRETARSPLP